MANDDLMVPSQRELGHGSRAPSETSGLVRSPAADALDRRLANSNDLHETIVLTQVRGELLRQDEEGRESQHRRRMQRTQFYYKLAIAPVAIGAGSVLVVTGFATAGLFMIGAGLAAFVPDYVSAVLRRRGDSDATS